ncbi:Rrf2 family transcriptional regulator [Ruminococcus flavefaciens]|uniref:Rrf2 family transcriptional regulator n=1 Tax=Ruminococcus flavefaciens TaxID=1265 RepID=UPI0026EAD92B|nr:Rrf2 family transcriptional regulator [Ruminococcus flavefaciens]MDD7517576.1 Rrf2 family transcriptional regulator [Ruminococcus flavefaciens]MDY5690151.1 Rrf2 family transcriptional regulator [Ruminococcus flavefaciens]
MQITSKFTVAVHILTCIDIFDGKMRVTSDFLSGSTGVNAVIVRNVLGQLRAAGIVETRQGSGGAHLAKALDEITLYDIYKAVDCIDDEGLFHFHENPNAECPVGRNIHKAMDGRLEAAQAALENELKSTTLAQVVADTRKIIDEE